MKNWRICCRGVAAVGCAVAAVVFNSRNVRASATLADWTFETSEPTASGPFAAEEGVNSGSSQAVGSHAGASTYSSPPGNGSSHSFSSTKWAVGDYYQFSADATGASGLMVQFDQVSSSTGPGQFQFQYSTDGVTFTNFGSAYTVLANSGANSWSSTTPRTTTTFSFDLSNVSALNNAVDYFRLVDASTVSASGGTVSSAGTDRVDNFIISANASAGGAHSLTWNPPGADWNTSANNTNWTDNNTSQSTHYTDGDEVEFTDAGLASGSTITIAAGGVSPGTTTFSNSSNVYILNSVDSNGLSGSGSLVKDNYGILILAGQNSYSGGTTINSGIISITNDNQLGHGGAVTLNGGTLETAGAVTLVRSVIVGPAGGAINTSGNNVSLGNSDGSGGTFTGTGNFVKTGGGTLTDYLSPNFTAGTFSVLGGVVDLNLGAGSATISAPASAGAFAGDLILDGRMTLNIAGGLIDGGGSVVVNTDGASMSAVGTSAVTTINNNIKSMSVGSLGLSASAGNTLVINGPVTSNGTLQFLSGSGTVQLNNGGNSSIDLGGANFIENTYASDSSHPVGVVSIGADNALPLGMGIQFGNATSPTDTTPANAGVVDLNGHNQTVRFLYTYFDFASNSYSLANGITNSSSTMSTLTIDDQGSGRSSAIFANPIGAVTASNFTGTDNIALTLAPTNRGDVILTAACTYAGPTDIEGGIVSLSDGSSIANSSVTIGAGGSLYVTAIAGSTIRSLNSTSSTAQLKLYNSVLTVENGGSYVGQISANKGTGGLVITGGTLQLSPGGARTAHLGTLSIIGGKVDLDNGNLIVDDAGVVGSTAAKIAGYIVSGYAGGKWDGNGIITSAAMSKPGTTLGYLDTGSMTEVKFTWYGDLDLSGMIDATDLAAFSAGNGGSWATGDLNYDHVKNADDYSLLLEGIAFQDGSISAGVPEPTALMFLMLPAILVVRRRKF